MCGEVSLIRRVTLRRRRSDGGKRVERVWKVSGSAIIICQVGVVVGFWRRAVKEAR